MKTRKIVLSVGVSFCLISCSTSSVRSPAADPTVAASWPTRGWSQLKERRPDVVAARMATPACQEYRRFVVESGHEKDGIKTDGIIVIRHGQVIDEWYDGTYTQVMPHSLWSATKTYSMTLAAAAIQQGKLSEDDLLTKYFPAENRPKKLRQHANEALYKKIRVRDLIDMGAGIEWHEAYDGDIRNSTVLPMIYTHGHKNMLAYASEAPMDPEGPGNKWNYSGGNSNILLGILRQIYKGQDNTYPWDLLFNPTGMEGMVFEQDLAGNFVGSSYIHTTPREMAKLGYLYLHDGVWNGKRILPTGWVNRVRQVSPAQKAAATSRDYIISEGTFGGTMWLNQAIPEKDIPLPFPNSPTDMYFASGHYGQWVIVFPSLDTVVARVGHDNEYWSKLDQIFSRMVACISEFQEGDFR